MQPPQVSRQPSPQRSLWRFRGGWWFWASATLLLPGCTRDGGTVIERPAAGPVPAPAIVSEPVVEAEAFTLTDQGGAPFDSALLRGKVWIGSVFFANCPGPCFRENQALADILREIDDPDLVVVSLTCDPDNDTPEALARYADRFQADPARWKFLTGEMATIKRVANDAFKLPAEVGVHSERGVVFDRAGRLRGGYHLLQTDRVELLKKLVREVLAEDPGSPPDGPPGETGPVEAAGARTGDRS